jgi:hypothetical protein
MLQLASPNKLYEGILVYNNSNGSQELVKNIEDLLNNSNDAQWSPSRIIRSPEEGYVVDKSIRDNLYFWLNYNLDYEKETKLKMIRLNSMIDTAILPSLFDYQSKYGVQIKSRDPYELLKYYEDNHLSSHTDDGGDNHSRVSLLFYINDDYEGGEIVFEYLNVSYSPKVGDIIIFPSSYIYRHHVNKVTKGVRYCIADFMA